MTYNPFHTIDEKLDSIVRMLTEIRNENVSYSQKQSDYLPATGGIELAVLITGLKKSTVYKMVSSKKIPFSKPSGKLIFVSKDLLEWIKENNQDVKR